MPVNQHGQPIGIALPAWQPPPRPAREPMAGRFCRVEPLDVDRHGADLYRAYAEDVEGRLWTYMHYGPFHDAHELVECLRPFGATQDPLFFAVVDPATGRATGVASYLRIDPANGCVEVGSIAYAPLLQRTPAATEAMYLMMRRAFELGYRRYEWKCDSLNAPSREAALRLGFTFEGLFRQAVVYKGRNRDTAWYAVIDAEWPRLRTAFEAWLRPENFDDAGRQRVSLREIRG